MTSSVVIKHIANEPHPEIYLAGDPINMDSVRRLEYVFVLGQAAVLTVEYCVGGSHLAKPQTA